MLKELLQHQDELNVHIENLNDEIDNFMKPEEKQASQMIQDVTGIGNTSAQAIIAVIGTDMVDCYQDRMCHCYISPFLSSVGTDPFELGMKIRTFMSYRCMRAKTSVDFNKAFPFRIFPPFRFLALILSPGHKPAHD